MKTGRQRFYLVPLAILGLTSVGCSTTSSDFGNARLPLPNHVGSLHDAEIVDGIQVILSGPSHEVVRGEPLAIILNVKNHSRDIKILPNPVQVLLTCVYPDGTRSYSVPVGEDVGRQLANARLAPGEVKTTKAWFESDRFTQTGLIEVRALVSFSDPKRKPAPHQWTGRALSNGYGVRFAESDPAQTDLVSTL